MNLPWVLVSCHVIMAYTDNFHCSCCHCPMSAEQTRSLWASSSTPRFPFQGQGKQPDPLGSSQQLFAFCPGFTGGRTDTTGLKSCDTLLLIPVPLCHDGFGEGSRETDQRPEAEKKRRCTYSSPCELCQLRARSPGAGGATKGAVQEEVRVF